MSKRQKEDLWHGVFAITCIIVIAFGTRSYAAEASPMSKSVYDEELLYCTDLDDAKTLANAIAAAGEGTQIVSRPSACYYKRITYELVGVRSLHTVDHVFWVGVVEAMDAAAPATKYYLLVPTVTVLPSYMKS